VLEESKGYIVSLTFDDYNWIFTTSFLTEKPKKPNRTELVRFGSVLKSNRFEFGYVKNSKNRTEPTDAHPYPRDMFLKPKSMVQVMPFNRVVAHKLHTKSMNDYHQVAESQNMHVWGCLLYP